MDEVQITAGILVECCEGRKYQDTRTDELHFGSNGKEEGSGPFRVLESEYQILTHGIENDKGPIIQKYDSQKPLERGVLVRVKSDYTIYPKINGVVFKKGETFKISKRDIKLLDSVDSSIELVHKTERRKNKND